MLGGLQGVLVAALLCCLALAPQPSLAQTNQYNNTTTQNVHTEKDEVKLQAMRVLEGEAFHQIHTESEWQRKDKKDELEQVPQWLINITRAGERIAEFFSWLGPVLEISIWAFVILTIAFLCYRYRNGLTRIADWIRPNPASPKPPPEVLFGMDVRAESLPPDVLEVARQHWRNLEYRQAVSLLYRASLATLIHKHQCPFKPSDTELECVKRVQALKLSDAADFIQLLTGFWLRLAYGHQVLSDAEFSVLCKGWQETFSNDQ